MNALVPPLVDALVGVTQLASEYDSSRAERATRCTRTLLASSTDTVQLQYTYSTSSSALYLLRYSGSSWLCATMIFVTCPNDGFFAL